MIIDNQLPGHPRFKRHEVVVAGEAFELYARDIVECLKALWGDPEFSAYLVFQPERHYADTDHTIRMYHDMQMGKWWWATQVSTNSISSRVTCADTSITERGREHHKKARDYNHPHHHLLR